MWKCRDKIQNGRSGTLRPTETNKHRSHKSNYFQKSNKNIFFKSLHCVWSRPLSLSFSNCKISLTLPSPQFLEAVCCINPPEHWLNFYWRENLKWDLPFIRQMFNTNKNQFIFLLLLSIYIAVFFLLKFDKDLWKKTLTRVDIYICLIKDLECWIKFFAVREIIW